MNNSKNIVAFSGGKDSTAMALRMAETGETGTLLFTPAGNEPPELFDHLDAMVERIGWDIVKPPAPTLMDMIDKFEALPNFRQRWCTRTIKIMPCIAYLKQNPGSTLCVGLRADEEERQGLYGDYAEYRYPLREWGWSINDVWAYLETRDIRVPKRTDCMLCFGQRISEWYELWRDRPEEYQRGVDLEERIGHTFRSPQRDTWPAALKDLAAEFEAGRKPRGVGHDVQFPLFDTNQDHQPCRVCRI